MRLPLFLLAIGLLLAPAPGEAACTPWAGVGQYSIFRANASTSVEGDLFYNATTDAVQVCDGTNWLTLAANTPAGSTGYVQFNNAGAFGSDSNLFWDDTNNRLGIGTASPNTALDVFTTDGGGPWVIGGTGSQTESAYWNAQNRARFGYDGSRSAVTIDDKSIAGATTTKSIVFDTAGSERVRITSAGLVGIGSTTPVALLNIAGSKSAASWTTTGLNFATSANTLTDTSGSGTIATRVANSFGTPTFASSGSVTLTTAANLYIAAAPAAGSNTTITKGWALYVAAGDSYFGANVGIGTTTPSSRLQVASDIRIETGGASTLYLVSAVTSGSEPIVYGMRSGGTLASKTAVAANESLLRLLGEGYDGTSFDQTGRGQILINAAETFTSTAKGTYLSFWTTPTGSTSIGERVRIDPSGNVGIGSTTPVALLNIAGSKSAASWTTTGLNFATSANTLTDTSGSGTIATRVANSFGTPTFASSGSVTLTTAANLYIAAAPAAGSNTTITKGWALYVAAGDSYFGANVGIGTTSSAARLHVRSATSGTDVALEHADTAGDGTVWSELRTRMGGTDKWGIGSFGDSHPVPGLKNLFYVFQYTDQTDASAAAFRLVINDSGNVGIGTAAPQSTLHVPDGKYAQFEDNNAGAPTSADCDADAERGRLSIDTTNNRLYVCNGATRGWDYIALTN